MIKRIFLYVLLGFPTLNSCCKNSFEGHRSIFFTNKSDYDIYVDAGTQYPDTIFDQCFVVYHDSGEHRLPANSTCELLTLRDRNSSWEYTFTNMRPDIMIFWFIDVDSLISVCTDESIDWGHLSREIELAIDKKMVIKRKYYTLLDMDSLNWTITYP